MDSIDLADNFAWRKEPGEGRRRAAGAPCFLLVPPVKTDLGMSAAAAHQCRCEKTLMCFELSLALDLGIL